MRHPIWKKDDFFEPIGKFRIDMDPAVVKLPTQVPLTWGFDWSRRPLGEVTDISFEDGEITGEVTIFKEEDRILLEGEEMERNGYRLGGYYKEVKRPGDGTVVTSASLAGVSFMAVRDTPGAPR